jgi:adenylate kinase family enzyme
MMRRVVILGCAGAGKSRLANALAETVGLPTIRADQIFWRPGWTDPDNDAYRTEIDRLTAGDGWIFDGIPGRVADIVLPRADTVIWIEQPALLCVLRAYGRTLRFLGRTRPDMAAGCPERLSTRLWRYATQFNSAMRPRIGAWLEAYAPTTPMIRLNGDRAVALFLARQG